MLRSIAFKQVDVFTRVPLLGNPVAVILDGASLSGDEMQRLARWTNLSETTFVLPSEQADYRLRIFTPLRELPFAGHPTIGSARAAIEAGLVTPRDGALTQECIAGPIVLRVEEDGRIFARAPRPTVRALEVDLARLSAAIGAPLEPALAPARVDVGPVWLVAQVASVDALAAAQPDLAAVDAISVEAGTLGISAFAIVATADAAERVRVRSWAPVYRKIRLAAPATPRSAPTSARRGCSRGRAAHTSPRRDGRLAGTPASPSRYAGRVRSRSVDTPSP